MNNLRVEEGSQVPANARASRRPPIKCEGLTTTKAFHPQKNKSEFVHGIAEEDFGSVVADHVGYGLSGYERHAFAMLDQGLADYDDLF